MNFPLFQQISAIFFSYNWLYFLEIIEFIFGLISFALLVGIVIILRLHIKLKKSLELETPIEEAQSIFDAAPYATKWNSIEENMKSGDIILLKLSIIDADKLLDQVLGTLGYEGDLGEKLKQITSEQLGSIEMLWRAHKIRNQMVHNVDFEITAEDAVEVLEMYKIGLKELGIL